MSKGTAATVLMFLLVLGAWAEGQMPDVAPDQAYRFIDTGNMSTLAEGVVEAGTDGYRVLLFPRCPSRSHAGAILKRDGAGAKAYRVVHTRRYATFVKELNEAGSQSFRLVPAAIEAFNAGNGDNRVAVLERQPNGARFTYSAVKGDNDGIKALAEASKRGATLVAVLGDQFIFEDVQGSDASIAADEREYRVIATTRTSSLEKEIQQAAAEGFRAVHAGLMRVVMAREPLTAKALMDYRVLAMRRVSTAERELQAAGAEGFRIAVVPECTEQEGVFVLHRAPGTMDRWDYRVATLEKETAADSLMGAEAEGYRIAVLFNDVVIFERPLTR